ncbi:MAG: DNA-3-methyladenine glycosylase [Halanaerobium sp.]|nr:DNA-3-methyladenine glycosylase [Halanaerobium sp.]
MLYVYLIYGRYYCLNIVAREKGELEAVLIRAVEPLKGLETIRSNRKKESGKIEDLTNGPGKVCQALQIDTGFNAMT